MQRPAPLLQYNSDSSSSDESSDDGQPLPPAPPPTRPQRSPIRGLRRAEPAAAAPPTPPPRARRKRTVLTSPSRVLGAAAAKLQAARKSLAARRSQGRGRARLRRSHLAPLGPRLLTLQPSIVELISDVAALGASEHLRHHAVRLFRESGRALLDTYGAGQFRVFDLGFARNARSVAGEDVLIDAHFGGAGALELFPPELTPLPSVASLFRVARAACAWLDSSTEESGVAVLLARDQPALASLVACTMFVAGNFSHALDALGWYSESVLRASRPPPRAQALLVSTFTAVALQSGSEAAEEPEMRVESVRLSGAPRGGFRPYIMLMQGSSRVAYTSMVRGVQTYSPADGPIVFPVGCAVRGDAALRVYHVPENDAGQMQFSVGFHTSTVSAEGRVLLTFERDEVRAEGYPAGFMVEVLLSGPSGPSGPAGDGVLLKCRNVRCGALLRPASTCPDCGAAVAVPRTAHTGRHEEPTRVTEPLAEDDPRLGPPVEEPVEVQQQQQQQQQGEEEEPEQAVNLDEAVASVMAMFPDEDVALVRELVGRAARRGQPLEAVVEQLVLSSAPAPAPAAAPAPAGDAVETPYGAGIVVERRDDGVTVVQLAWGVAFLSGGAPPSLLAQIDQDELLALQLQQEVSAAAAAGAAEPRERQPGQLMDELLQMQGDVDFEAMSYEQLLRLDEGRGGGSGRRHRRSSSGRRHRRHHRHHRHHHHHQQQEPEFNPRGASAQQIRTLPTYQHTGGRKEGSDCMVCQYPFEDGETLRMLPCIHAYHAECIDPWLTRNKACPMCQRRIDETE